MFAFLAFALLCLSPTSASDIGVLINESVIAKLQVPLMPVVNDFLLSQSIKIGTIRGPMDLNLDPISFVHLDTEALIVRTEPDTHSLDIHIVGLRRKIEPEPATPILIQTVRGKGYRWHDAP